MTKTVNIELIKIMLQQESVKRGEGARRAMGSGK